MTRSLRAKIILCSACSAGLHFLLLEQFVVGQTTAARPLAELSDLKIRYIPSSLSPPAIDAVAKELQATDSRAPVMPILAKPIGSSTEIDETTLPISESVVVENFYDSSEIDEPASPETDWPIVVEGMTRGLTFNVQASIWISSLGRIERVEVLEIQPESEKVRRSLQTMVGTTVKPALRAGVNVANKRTIEIWLTQ